MSNWRLGSRLIRVEGMSLWRTTGKPVRLGERGSITGGATFPSVFISWDDGGVSHVRIVDLPDLVRQETILDKLAAIADD